MDEPMPTETGTRPRVTGLFIALIAAELLLLGTMWYTGYLWEVPLAVMALRIALGAVVLALMALVVSRAHRKMVGALVVFVLVAVLAVAFMLGSLLFPGSLLPRETRLRQMADEAGFTVLLPADRELEAHDRWGYEPASSLVDGVISIDYKDFTLAERASADVLAAAGLEEYVDLLEPEEGSGARLDIEPAEELSVLGRPAIIVSFNEVLQGKGVQNTVRILVFQPEGLVARIETAQESPMSVDMLVELAESLEPLE